MQPRRRLLETRAPLVAPPLAAERRERRHRVHAQLADRVLALLAGRDAAAADVDVVAIPVVGRVHRQDRAEVRRPQLRDLDRREAAVADAPHADAAGAPRLGREPLHGVEPVERLRLGVLVERHAGRAAGPADVEAAEREPARREPLPEGRVPVAAPVVLAVRDHLEDHRERASGASPVAADSAATGWPTARGRRGRGSARPSGPRCSKAGASAWSPGHHIGRRVRGPRVPVKKSTRRGSYASGCSMTARVWSMPGTIQNRRRSTPDACAASRSSSA